MYLNQHIFHIIIIKQIENSFIKFIFVSFYEIKSEMIFF